MDIKKQIKNKNLKIKFKNKSSCRIKSTANLFNSLPSESSLSLKTKLVHCYNLPRF